MVSMWPVKHSGALSLEPPMVATRLARFGDNWWYATLKPAFSSSVPRRRAHCSSSPGGLIVFMRTICLVSSTASMFAATTVFSSRLLPSEIRFAHFGVLAKLIRVAGRDHPALEQHVAAVRDRQRLFHIAPPGAQLRPVRCWRG